MNLDAAVHGALAGSLIGAAAGLMPLAVGHLCRERRKGIRGFFVCVLAGALGGLYASIAVMVAATAYIMQPQGEAEAHGTQWSGLAHTADKFWYSIGIFWLLVSMCGTMFVSAAFLTPIVRGVPNTRHSGGTVVELVMLFGGLGLGMIIGFVGVSFISRRFISAASHSNWAKSLETSTMNRSPLLRKIARYYYACLLPRNWPWPRDR
jgi:hypothetical protein